MLCRKCGHSLQPEAMFCGQCGEPTSQPTIELFKSNSSPNVIAREGNAIWNPNAASNWSIIFTPVFGSYLHALNWRTLGEEEHARSAMGWFYASLAMLFVYVLISVFDSKSGDATVRGLGFLYLIIWYFSVGRKQAKYVKTKFGSNYPRRSWGKPLLIAIAAIAGYIVAAFVIGFIIGIMMA